LKLWNILVTGSSGLIGSEAVEYFDGLGHTVIGVDNNMRRTFFGPPGDTGWNLRRLKAATKRFSHADIDLRDRASVFDLFTRQHFDVVLHCAAQPSHDKAGEIPLLDFEVNTVATVYLLEATRQHCPEATFIFMSTNKVYGDAPNEKPLQELAMRYDYAASCDFQGIDESCRIDRTLHSLFGASKTAADIYAQEYGKYFGLNVGVFRAGCVTGPQHSGVELHGFLSHLVRMAVSGGTYTIFGYSGKQVRDNIHSYDAVRALEEFIGNPSPGEVYNLGGGRENSISILEAIALLEEFTGRKVVRTYCEQPRKGDHICYISNLKKLKSQYPGWQITRDVPSILKELIATEEAKARREAGSRAALS
jgi:CDP-paratose 2-epimerase